MLVQVQVSQCTGAGMDVCHILLSPPIPVIVTVNTLIHLFTRVPLPLPDRPLIPTQDLIVDLPRISDVPAQVECILPPLSHVSHMTEE